MSGLALAVAISAQKSFVFQGVIDMITTPSNENNSFVGVPRDNLVDALLRNDQVKGLTRNNTPIGNGRNDVLDRQADNNKLLSTNADPQTAKKPRLEASWVNENGKLICQWLCYENEEA
jgi:hypothetical protein